MRGGQNRAGAEGFLQLVGFPRAPARACLPSLALMSFPHYRWISGLWG